MIKFGIKACLILVVSVFLFVPALAQSGFEGQIEYKIVYEKVPAEMKSMEDYLPTSMTIMVKGDRTRTDQTMMGAKQSTIIDAKNNKVYILMDAMGDKVKGSMDLDKMDKKHGTDINIKYVDGDTKDVAGYKCKRAEVTSKDSVTPIVVYYTEDIDGSLNHVFEGLKGFPLKYQTLGQGISMTVTAATVEEKTLDQSLFEVPDGYKEMDPALMERAMGGQ